MQFTKAERKKAKLRLGLTGASGSGKTYSALMVAKGMGGKVAVIDTEHGSASLYANDFDYGCYVCFVSLASNEKAEQRQEIF
jgi:ABC-type dipeptide/oligopeptide/nickel transport system ATPase component